MLYPLDEVLLLTLCAVLCGADGWVSVALFGTAAMFLVSLSHAVAVRPGLDPQKKLLVMSVVFRRVLRTKRR